MEQQVSIPSLPQSLPILTPLSFQSIIPKKKNVFRNQSRRNINDWKKTVSINPHFATIASYPCWSNPCTKKKKKTSLILPPAGAPVPPAGSLTLPPAGAAVSSNIPFPSDENQRVDKANDPLKVKEKSAYYLWNADVWKYNDSSSSSSLVPLAVPTTTDDKQQPVCSKCGLSFPTDFPLPLNKDEELVVFFSFLVSTKAMLS